MYETVIYVPFFLSILGLGFLLAPICRGGLGDAWRMTALPAPVGSMLPGEATPLDDRRRSLLPGGAGGWTLASWALLPARLALAALVVGVLALAPSRPTWIGRSRISTTSSSGSSASACSRPPPGICRGSCCRRCSVW
jgi:hypothetical protein